MDEAQIRSEVLKQYLNEILGISTSSSVTVIIGICKLLDIESDCLSVIEETYLNDDMNKHDKIRLLIQNIKSNIVLIYTELGLTTNLEDVLDISINIHADILDTLISIGGMDVSNAMFISNIIADTELDDISKLSKILFVLNNDINEHVVHDLITLVKPNIFNTLSKVTEDIISSNIIISSTDDLDVSLLTIEAKLVSDLKVIDINHLPKQVLELITDIDDLHSFIVNKQYNYSILNKKLTIVKLDNNLLDYRNEAMKMIMIFIIVESMLDPIRYMDEVKLLITDLQIDLNIAVAINNIMVNSNILTYLIGKYNAKY